MGPQFDAGAFQVALVVKTPPASAEDTTDAGSVPELGRCPGVGNGNPLQYSCLEKSIGRGAWRAMAWSTESDATEHNFMLVVPDIQVFQASVQKKIKKYNLVYPRNDNPVVSRTV